jgi:phage baseplate assembly protein W
MIGTSNTTGKAIAGLDHLRQSIRDILTTPIGSRIMRRDFGSHLHELVDAPTNSSTILALFSATAVALDRWEPRVRVLTIAATEAAPGRVVLSLTGEYLPDGVPVTVDGIEVS